jgi:DNA-binding transcriptional LysR family regulator
VELRQLQYFISIARLGGFRRAADDLSVSQATLSEQLKFLEQELGVRLLERSRRSVALTEAGLVLLDRAERMLEEAKAAREEMREFARLERGQLIIGTLTGSTWLPSFLGDVLRRYPHVDITLVQRTSGQLVKLLDSREIHLACLLLPLPGGTPPRPGICIRPLFARKVVAVVSRRHRLAKRANIRLDELAEERLVLSGSSEALSVVVSQAFKDAGLNPSVWLEADDLQTRAGLAVEGISVAFMSDIVAHRYRDQLVTLNIEGPPLLYWVALGWSEQVPRMRALPAFLDFTSTWLNAWAAALQPQEVTDGARLASDQWWGRTTTITEDAQTMVGA